jgi:hypothetical protein
MARPPGGDAGGMDDDQKDRMRGGELAHDAGGPGVAPNVPADGGVRGDELPKDVVDGHEDGLANDALDEEGIRGDGLAEDG